MESVEEVEREVKNSFGIRSGSGVQGRWMSSGVRRGRWIEVRGSKWSRRSGRNGGSGSVVEVE